MRRAFVISAVVAALASAGPALAQAPAASSPNAKGRCVKELLRAGFLSPGVDLSTVNIIAGTQGDDGFPESLFTDGVDLVCGFAGNDSISGTLQAPDVFLGGLGSDSIYGVFEGRLCTGGLSGGTFEGGGGFDHLCVLASGTFRGGDDLDLVEYLAGDEGAAFIGGPGDDQITWGISGGTFDGGDGDDSVGVYVTGGAFNGGDGSDSVSYRMSGGTFNGGAGDDRLPFLDEGVFNGGDGNDEVWAAMSGGIFNGEAGDDYVYELTGGTFNGGPGNDAVAYYLGGTFNQD
jgi:hypothetical protein